MAYNITGLNYLFICL